MTSSKRKELHIIDPIKTEMSLNRISLSCNLINVARGTCQSTDHLTYLMHSSRMFCLKQGRK